MAQAKWEDPDRAEAIEAKMHEAPERFISPNPGTDYKEEASRVYEKIKDEYGLRTFSEAEERYQNLEDKAERHAKRKRRECERDDPADDPAFRFDTDVDVELLERPTSAAPDPVELPAPADRPDLIKRPAINPADDPDPDPAPAEPTESTLSILADILLAIFGIFGSILLSFGDSSEPTTDQSQQQQITQYQ